MYRLVPSVEQLTGEGRIYKSGSGACSAWAHGAQASGNLQMDDSLAALMKGLYAGCSLTVRDGRVTAVTLRPVAAARKNSGSAAGLSAQVLENLDVTIAAVLRQSKLEGKATPDGATMIISTRLARFTVNLGGEMVMDRDSTARFLTLKGAAVVLNPKMEAGAVAKIGARNDDGTWRTLTFTKRDQRTVVIRYETSGSIRQ